MLLYFNISFNYFILSSIKFYNSKSMISCELIASISPHVQKLYRNGTYVSLHRVQKWHRVHKCTEMALTCHCTVSDVIMSYRFL